MAFYVLNCCIDVPSHNLKKENLNINKQESILELVIEKLLCFDNAIAEYDDCDTETGLLKKIITLDVFITPSPGKELHKSYIFFKMPDFSMKSDKAATPFYEIHSPPPEA